MTNTIYPSRETGPPSKSPIISAQLETPLRRNTGASALKHATSYTKMGKKEEAEDVTGELKTYANLSKAKPPAHLVDLGDVHLVSPEIVPNNELPYDLNEMRNENKSPRYSKFGKKEIQKIDTDLNYDYHYGEKVHEPFMNVMSFGKLGSQHKGKHHKGKKQEHKDDNLIHHDENGFPKHFGKDKSNPTPYMEDQKGEGHEYYEAEESKQAFLEKKSKTHKKSKWPFHVRTAIGKYVQGPGPIKTFQKRLPNRFKPLYGKPGVVSTAVNDVPPHALKHTLIDAPAIPFVSPALPVALPNRVVTNEKTLVSVHRPIKAVKRVPTFRPLTAYKRLHHGVPIAGGVEGVPGVVSMATNGVIPVGMKGRIPKRITNRKILPKPLQRRHL